MPLLAHGDRPIYEGPGWDTPEEAVLYYLEGLKEQDIDKMIGAYAVESYIDRFDLIALITRISAYSPSMVPRMPNTGDLLRAINIEARKNEIVQSILLQIGSICLPEEDLLQMIPFTQENREEEIQEFVGGLENAFGAVDFSTLDILTFFPPEALSALYASEQNQDNIKRQIAHIGADEARSMVVVFAVDGKICAWCCDVMRYGDRWYMLRAHGNIGNLMGLEVSTGGIIQINLSDFLNLLGE